MELDEGITVKEVEYEINLLESLPHAKYYNNFSIPNEISWNDLDTVRSNVTKIFQVNDN